MDSGKVVMIEALGCNDIEERRKTLMLRHSFPVLDPYLGGRF